MPATCGCEQHLLHRPIRVIGRQGHGVEHVERRAGQVAALQRLDQGSRPARRAARHVDEPCALAHRGQLGCTNEAPGFGVSGQASTTKSLAASNAANGTRPTPTAGRRSARTRVRQHPHRPDLPRRCVPRPADVAESHQAHGAPRQLNACIRKARAAASPPHARACDGSWRRCGAPAASCLRARARRRVGVDARNIGHEHAVRAGRVDGDHVDARAVPNHADQARRSVEDVVGQLGAHDDHVATGGARGAACRADVSGDSQLAQLRQPWRLRLDRLGEQDGAIVRARYPSGIGAAPGGWLAARRVADAVGAWRPAHRPLRACRRPAPPACARAERQPWSAPWQAGPRPCRKRTCGSRRRRPSGAGAGSVCPRSPSCASIAA